MNKITYNDKLIFIKLKATPNDILLIKVYIPTSDSEHDTIEEVYSGLEELSKLAKGKCNLRIMGDWNVIVWKCINGQEIGDYGIGTRNERDDRFVNHK